MKKISLPINKDKLPFLERQGLAFEIVENASTSTEPIMQKVLDLTCQIQFENTPSNMVDFGQALVNYGVSLGLKAKINLPETGTGFESGSINDEAARLAAHG